MITNETKLLEPINYIIMPAIYQYSYELNVSVASPILSTHKWTRSDDAVAHMMQKH